jgi:hypothetical protein
MREPHAVLEDAGARLSMLFEGMGSATLVAAPHAIAMLQRCVY